MRNPENTKKNSALRAHRPRTEPRRVEDGTGRGEHVAAQRTPMPEGALDTPGKEELSKLKVLAGHIMVEAPADTGVLKRFFRPGLADAAAVAAIRSPSEGGPTGNKRKTERNVRVRD